MSALNPLKLVLPDVCPICVSALRSPEGETCPVCAQALESFAAPRCSGCGGYNDGALDYCGECLRAGPRPWNHAVSVFPFGGTARDLIHRLKYQGHTYLAPVLARRMADAWKAHGNGEPDCLVPVPMHWLKRIVRGYNQAALLAQELGELLHVPVRNLLARAKRTRQQAMLDLSSRQTNVNGAFRLRRGCVAPGSRVLLVDDVLTTGSTLAAAAETLGQAETEMLCVVTVARG